jgi:hypothetical protein
VLWRSFALPLKAARTNIKKPRCAVPVLCSSQHPSTAQQALPEVQVLLQAELWAPRPRDRVSHLLLLLLHALLLGLVLCGVCCWVSREGGVACWAVAADGYRRCTCWGAGPAGGRAGVCIGTAVAAAVAAAAAAAAKMFACMSWPATQLVLT